MQEPAHKIFIHKFLDWNKVQDRLKHYKHIANHYDIRYLKECSEKPPYYCHYLAWRLGTWRNEKLFEFFDDLLAFSSSLKNWKSNKNLLRSYSFDDFWGLLWQLQVAKYFSRKKDINIEWMSSGPDLKITTGKEDIFIECYTYRKSFGIEEFIGEIFRHIHPNITVHHTRYIKFSLPKNSNLESFLNDIFVHYTDTEFLQAKVKEAEREWPVILPVPSGIDNLYIYLEGDDPDNYVAGDNACGDPENYLNISIREALNSKDLSNNLKNSHPNILAVNFLLGEDFQTAYDRQLYLGNPVPLLLQDNHPYDAVFLSVCGIYEIPTFEKKSEKTFLWIKPGVKYPIETIL